MGTLRLGGFNLQHIPACPLSLAPCSVEHILHILFHALLIYPHIPESGVMLCANVLVCTGLKLKAIYHVVAPLRSTTPVE